MNTCMRCEKPINKGEDLCKECNKELEDFYSKVLQLKYELFKPTLRKLFD